MNLGVLNTSQLALGFWGRLTYPIQRIIEELNSTHDLEIKLSEEEIATMEADLEKRICGKEARSSEHWQQVRQAYVARKRTSQKAQTSYKSGGSEEAVGADLAALPAGQKEGELPAWEASWTGGHCIAIDAAADMLLEELDHEVQGGQEGEEMEEEE